MLLENENFHIIKTKNDILDDMLIKKNIDTCKKYNFEEGSNIFNTCLIKLIEKNQ